MEKSIDPSTRRYEMKKAAFLLGFGLLPFWAAWIVVWRGSIGAPAEYWNVAPWLIVVSLPVSAITLVIASVTMIVHARTSGEPHEKFRAAAKTFGGLAGLCALGVGVWYLQWRGRDEALQQRAVALVGSHPAIARELGPNFQTGPVTTTTFGADDRPKWFEISVSSGTKRGYAIVDVAGNRVRFACLTSPDRLLRVPGKHPCEGAAIVRGE